MYIVQKVEIDWLYGDTKTLGKHLEELSKKYPTAKSFEISQVWDGYEDCHDELWITRPETSEEEQSRLDIHEMGVKQAAEMRQKKLRKKEQAVQDLEEKFKKDLEKLKAED